MIITKWTATWRRAGKPIDVVEHPTATWFMDKLHTRFVVLLDGRVLWGDGSCVIHGDLTRAAADGHAGGPLGLLAGVVMRGGRGEPWFLAALEYSPLAVSRDRVEAGWVEAIIKRLSSWREDTTTLGELHQREDL